METRLCRDHAPLAGQQKALTALGTGALQRGGLDKRVTSYVMVPLSDHPLMLALRSWRLASFYDCDGWSDDV